MDLSLENTSFYDFGKISPKGSDTEPEGPVKDVPGRVVSSAFDFTTMKQMVPAKNPTKDAPKLDPTYWNMGGNGQWWSMFREDNDFDGGKVVNK